MLAIENSSLILFGLPSLKLRQAQAEVAQLVERIRQLSDEVAVENSSFIDNN
jgi:hypothetical protein